MHRNSLSFAMKAVLWGHTLVSASCVAVGCGYEWIGADSDGVADGTPSPAFGTDLPVLFDADLPFPLGARARCARAPSREDGEYDLVFAYDSEMFDVLSPADGRVIYGYDDSYLVRANIALANNTFFSVGYLTELEAVPNSEVGAGEFLGRVGCSGVSDIAMCAPNMLRFGFFAAGFMEFVSNARHYAMTLKK